MTIHTCSYYCTRPECVRAQRDELRDRYVEAAQPPADIVLPPLYEPLGVIVVGTQARRAFTAEQMVDYARAAVLLDRERR